MSIIAAVFVPLVLVYQGWTYYVFRARVIGPRNRRPPRILRPTGHPLTDMPGISPDRPMNPGNGSTEAHRTCRTATGPHLTAP